MFLIRILTTRGYDSLTVEAGIRIPDVPCLIRAVLSGGVIAPILLMSGLEITSAATASLLLNYEGVSTMIIAFWGIP
jgi:drug/metabolite transporter (DMT)-like permease